MGDKEKDRLASSVVDRHCEFEEALAGNRRKYPIREFRLFAQAVRLYIEKTQRDRMIHRDVAQSVNGLGDYLRVERKRVTGEVLYAAERLECLLFAGYDPHFDGDEPPVSERNPAFHLGLAVGCLFAPAIEAPGREDRSGFPDSVAGMVSDKAGFCPFGRFASARGWD
jgi:hypothetical protein